MAYDDARLAAFEILYRPTYQKSNENMFQPMALEKQTPQTDQPNINRHARARP
jgi:hypothetical protein